MRFALLVFAALGVAMAQDDGHEWLDNYQEALKQARATGKPIFLEYRCEP